MMDRGTRAALVLGVVPIIVGLLYLSLQVVFGDPATWDFIGGLFLDIESGKIIALFSGNIDPAGVTMLIAFGLAMGFGMLVILRGARDL